MRGKTSHRTSPFARKQHACCDAVRSSKSTAGRSWKLLSAQTQVYSESCQPGSTVPLCREEERGRIAPEALMSVYLRLPSYEKRPVVKAIVFYGRRYSARLLNCYLERNLQKSGGLLSEVRRIASTAAE